MSIASIMLLLCLVQIFALVHVIWAVDSLRDRVLWLCALICFPFVAYLAWLMLCRSAKLKKATH
jgi:hypothetical protein